MTDYHVLSNTFKYYFYYDYMIIIIITIIRVLAYTINANQCWLRGIHRDTYLEMYTQMTF